MIYIGDLSSADFKVLSNEAHVADRILEFGCGASTQILRKFGYGDVISVETDPNWIERTRENLELLGIDGEVDFRDYYTFTPDGEYDLIFSDGADEFRLPFAEAAWKHLKIGGKLLFHDTRRQKDIDNVAEFLKKHSPEIKSIHINPMQSNITIIEKREAIFYVNWNGVEGKPAWLSGYEEVNKEELKKLMEDDAIKTTFQSLRGSQVSKEFK